MPSSYKGNIKSPLVIAENMVNNLTQGRILRSKNYMRTFLERLHELDEDLLPT